MLCASHPQFHLDVEFSFVKQAVSHVQCKDLSLGLFDLFDRFTQFHDGNLA